MWLKSQGFRRLKGLVLEGAVVLFVWAINGLAQEQVGQANAELDSFRWDFEQALDAGGEYLYSRDFQLSQWTIGYGHSYESLSWDFGLIYDTYDLDLNSPDPFFDPVSTSADRILAQLNLTKPLSDTVTWQGIGGYYDGFQNFRSLWLHDYYAQIGALPFFGGYPDVSPRGFQLGSQLRWEYLPGSGYLETTLGYYKDWIAPSAEFERETVLGLSVIDSWTFRVASENLLGPRVRSLFEFQLTDTRGRQQRFSFQESLNVSLGERWVWRTQGGWVTEDPGFEALFVGSSWEYDLTERWLVSAYGRYYHDTGEIQNSLPASNAPPGLDSYQVGLGIRWVGDRHSVKLSGGPYFTRYEEANVEAPFFEDLYQPRDWGMIQVAYSLRF
jgi:hypothetical protein